MSDRAYIATLIAACVVCLGAMVWVISGITAPRHAAEAPRTAGAHDDRFERLETRLEALTAALEKGLPLASPTGPFNATSPVATPPVPASGEILVVVTDDALPLTEPLSPAWDRAPATIVKLQAQDQTMPTLDVVTVPEVSVQALTDRGQIAWRLSWSDPTADFFMDADVFCDAAAIQLPLTPNASYKMGDRDFQVQVFQWKALWQKDIDEHFQDVQDLHPNYWADLYWFAEGEFPYPVPAAFQRTEALDYFVAYRAGNPVADLYRKQPVQEMIAEGFGTLTVQEQSASIGRGEWQDGRWYVTFGRPLQTNDPDDYQFKAGTRDVVGFAVWDGSAGHVSGRKQHSQWVVFEVQP